MLSCHVHCVFSRLRCIDRRLRSLPLNCYLCKIGRIENIHMLVPCPPCLYYTSYDCIMSTMLILCQISLVNDDLNNFKCDPPVYSYLS